MFQAGEYEDAIPRNSTFAEGDWNGDGEFDSNDLILAFQAGNYEVPVAASFASPRDKRRIAVERSRAQPAICDGVGNEFIRIVRVAMTCIP